MYDTDGNSALPNPILQGEHVHVQVQMGERIHIEETSNHLSALLNESLL